MVESHTWVHIRVCPCSKHLPEGKKSKDKKLEHISKQQYTESLPGWKRTQRSSNSNQLILQCEAQKRKAHPKSPSQQQATQAGLLTSSSVHPPPVLNRKSFPVGWIGHDTEEDEAKSLILKEKTIVLLRVYYIWGLCKHAWENQNKF